MNINEMERCLLTIADYMQNKDESPLAARDLRYIAKYIKKTQERLDWLECLESAGVDNWSGIEYAYEIKRKYFKE